MEWPSGRDDAAVWGLAEVGRRRGVVAGADMGLLAIVVIDGVWGKRASTGAASADGRAVYSNPRPTEPGTKIGGADIIFRHKISQQVQTLRVVPIPSHPERKTVHTAPATSPMPPNSVP